MATTSPAGRQGPLDLFGATGGRSYAHARAGGYPPAMIVMGALCVAAAVVTALFVSDARAGAHHCVPRSPEAGCAVAVPTTTVPTMTVPAKTLKVVA